MKRYFEGLRFGLLLQLAVGPMCLMVFNTAKNVSFLVAMSLVLAIALVDAFYILLASLGVSKIMEKKRVKTVFKIVGSLVLILFGLNIILNVFDINIIPGLDINKFNLDVVDSFEEYKMGFNELKDKCFQVFDEELKQKCNQLFNNYFNDIKMMDINKTVIHGDLSTDHIIITENGVGIIDFGDTRVFDKAYDFQWLYMLGEDTLDKALTMYNNKIDDYFKKRVQFYTSIIPYHGVVYAKETNNKEMLKKELNKIRGN